jgi:hypothetical protein
VLLFHLEFEVDDESWAVTPYLVAQEILLTARDADAG